MSWLFWVFAAIVILFCFVVFRGAPYVPSLRRDVAKAFDELYGLGAKDTLIDVGSGDGVILRMATARGAKAVGYELNPALVLLTRFFSRHDRSVRVYWKDFWPVHLPDETTVVYAFTVTRDAKKMGAKLQREATRLQRPLYLISYGNSIPGGASMKQMGAHYLYRFDPLQAKKA